MKRIGAPCLLAWLFVLAGCETAPVSEQPEARGDVERSPISYFARAECEPLAALLKLHEAYPAARFYLEKVENGVVGSGKATELKFRDYDELEAGVRAPQGALVWVKCVLDNREVSVTVTHRHMDIKAGPYLWHLRGKARESARAFVEGTGKTFGAAGVVKPIWHVTMNPLSPKAATALCERLGISGLDVFTVNSAGRMTPAGKVSRDGLGEVKRPAVAELWHAGARLRLEFIEQDDEIIASIEAHDAAAFIDMANKAETPN